MAFTSWLPFLFGMMLLGGLVLVVTFVLVTLADTQVDRLSPFDCCKRLNLFAVPEMALHTALLVLFLITGNLLEVVMNVPLAAYHSKIAVGNSYRVDPTEIFRKKKGIERIFLAKLSWYIFMLAYCLIRIVLMLIYGTGSSHWATTVGMPVSNVLKRVIVGN